MNLPEFSWLFPVFLVFTRAAGMMAIMPVFSGQMIPRPVRVAIAALMAIAVAPAALPEHPAPPTWVDGLLQIAHEFVVGVIMGLVARVLFYGLEVAGEFISVAIGLSLSPQIDPFTRDRASPPNIMLVSLGTILFLATDSHLWCLLAFSRSFEVVSPTDALSRETAIYLFDATAQIFLVALQIAAPLLAISFVVNLCFATLGRAAPSLNVFILSFPVQIMAGLFLFTLTLTLAAQQIINAFYKVPENMLEALR